jgi:hypothetical protein
MRAIAALALNAVYATFGKKAFYTAPGGGAPVPCTVIEDSRDREAPFAQGGRPFLRGNVLKVRVSEIAIAAKGGVLAVTEDGVTYTDHKILHDPERRDPERLEWTCTAA